MRKIINLCVLFIFLIYTPISTFANYSNILYIKYRYTPVLSSTDSGFELVTVLNKGYIVSHQSEFGDYDGKTGYISN